MANRKERNPKREALRKAGTLNPRPNRVTDEQFADSDFFDPDDLLQVKYEMLRRVRADDFTVRQAARLFGFSRPSFYHAQEAFTRGGLGALVPQKRGPRGAHKLSQEVVEFVEKTIAADPSADVVASVQKVFGISVHRRSVERALERTKKKKTLAATPPDGRGALTDGPEQATRYEDLRRQVTGQGGGHRMGLALFQRDGMKAWLDAWSSCLNQGARPRRDECEQTDPSKHLNLNGDTGEMVRLVAGMAMATLLEAAL